MYNNLVEIGLNDYLEEYFFHDKWIQEPYLMKLDNFVATKSADQKAILLKKFSSNNDHTILNDHLYELMVACAFHPQALFIREGNKGGTPDIKDGNICIEIKNINAPPEEIERVKRIVPNSIQTGKHPEDVDYESRFKTKFSFRVDKAKRQLNGTGLIYIIWDTTLKGSTKLKPLISSLMDSLCENEMIKNPHIEIKHMDFVELRKKLL